MNKQAEIKVGSDVKWMVKVHPELDYKAGIDAKVTEIIGSVATISVMKHRAIDAPLITFQVPVSDLENKTWIRDETAFAEYERKRRAKATVVSPVDWQGGFIEADGERVFDCVDDYLEHCEDEEIEPKSYLYCVRYDALEQVDTDIFVEHIGEQVGDEHTDELKGLEDLQKAINAFYQANNHFYVYNTDYSKVVEVQTQEAIAA